MGYGIFLPCCGAKTGKKYVIKTKNKTSGASAFGNIRGRIFRPCCGTKNGGKYVISPSERPGHSSDGDQQDNVPPNINVLQQGAEYEIHEVQSAFEDPEHESSADGHPIDSSDGAYGCQRRSFGDCSTSNDNEKETMPLLEGHLASCLENMKSLEEENVALEKKICDRYEENDGLVISVCNQHFNVITEMISELLSTTLPNDSLCREIEDNPMNADGSRKSNDMELTMGTKADEELCRHSGSQENIEIRNQTQDSHIQHPEEDSLQEKKTSEEEVTGLQAPPGTKVNVDKETAPFINLKAALPEIRDESVTLTEKDLNDVEKMLQGMEVTSLQAPLGTKVKVDTKTAPFIDLKAALPEIRDESVTLTGMDLNNVKKMLQETEVIGLQAALGPKVNVDTKTAPSIDLNAALPEIQDKSVKLKKRDVNDVEKMLQETEVSNQQAPLGTKANVDTKTAPFIDLKAALPEIRDESVKKTKRDVNDVEKMLQETEVTGLQGALGPKVNVDTKTAAFIDLKAALPEIRDESVTLTERDVNDVKKMLQEMEVTSLQAQPGAGVNVDVETAPSKNLNAALPVILNDSERLMERKHEPSADGKPVGSNSEVAKGHKTSFEEYNSSKNNNLLKLKKKKTSQLLNGYLASLDGDQDFNKPLKMNVLKKRSIKRAFRHPKHESSADGQSMISNHEANSSHRSSSEDCSTSKNNGPLNFNERETVQSLDANLASCQAKNVKSLEEENVLMKKTCDQDEENKGLAISACSQYANVITDPRSQVLSTTSQNARPSFEIDDQKKADGYKKGNEMKIQMGTKGEKELRQDSGSLEDTKMKNQALDIQKEYPKKNSIQVRKIREELLSTTSHNTSLSYKIEDDQKNADGSSKGNEMKLTMGTKAEKELHQDPGSLENTKIKNQALDVYKQYPKKDSIQVRNTREEALLTTSHNARPSYEIEDDQKNADGYSKGNEMKLPMGTKAEKELRQDSGSLENIKLMNQALDVYKQYPKKDSLQVRKTRGEALLTNSHNARLSYEIEDDQKNADGYSKGNEMKLPMGTKAEKELRQDSGSLENSTIKNQALDVYKQYPKKDSLQVRKTRGEVLSNTSHNARISYEIEDGQKNADGYSKGNEMKLPMGTKAEKELRQDSGSLENTKIKNQALDVYKQYPKKDSLQVRKTRGEVLSTTSHNARLSYEIEDDQKNADGYSKGNEMKLPMGTKAERELRQHSGSLENIKVKNQALDVYKEYPKKDSIQVRKTRGELLSTTSHNARLSYELEDDQKNADGHRKSNEMKLPMGTKDEKELRHHSGSLENIKVKNQALDVYKEYPKKDSIQVRKRGGELLSTTSHNARLSYELEEDQKNADGHRKSEMKLPMGTKAEKELRQDFGSLENTKIKNQALDVYKEYPKKDSIQVRKTRGEEITRPKRGTKLNVEAETAQSTDLNAALSDNRNKSEMLMKKKHEFSANGQPIGSHYEIYRRHRRSLGDYNTSKKYDALNFNEKETMRSLNDRLASYLENVKSLEEENAALEKKILDWYKENEGLVSSDSSQHFNVISDLMSQILSISSHNASISQDIDDNQMNADGYRKSYETELMMRSQAEEKLRHHRGLLESIKMENQSLDSHIKYLKEESLQARKTSEEEVTGLQAPPGTRVNVEVETAPFKDLNAALSEIRNESQMLMERNINDLENMFQEMTTELSREGSSGVEHLIKNIENLRLSSNELMKLKHLVFTLETELKKQRDMKTVHECTLAEIREHYSSNLRDLQDVISVKESHLANIQYKLKHLNYENLNLDLKASLEKEIDAYTHMLGEHHNLPLTHHTEK